MQISGTARLEEPGLLSVAVGTRLVIGTFVCVALAVALGIEGVARDATIPTTSRGTRMALTL